MEERSASNTPGESPHARGGKYAPLALVSAGVIAIDQVTKALATHQLQSSPFELLNGALTLDYARNTGAAFSIFRSGDVALSVVAVLVCVALLVYYQRTPTASPIVRLAIGLILGGAIGNLIDRIRLGYVVDFIDLHRWPVFNLADSAIVIGVLLLALMSSPMSPTNDA